MAVDVLKSKGVPEERILFLNLIAAPEGAKRFAEKFPKLRVVTAFVDQGLDDKKYACLRYYSGRRADNDIVILFLDSATLATDSTVRLTMSRSCML